MENGILLHKITKRQDNTPLLKTTPNLFLSFSSQHYNVSPLFQINISGHAGARNCKFLEKVTITDYACKSDANWKQYAVHAPDVPVRKIAEFNKYKDELMQDPAVQEMPVQSMIAYPSPNDIIAAAKSGLKSIYVKGIAWGGGGQGIAR